MADPTELSDDLDEGPKLESWRDKSGMFGEERVAN